MESEAVMDSHKAKRRWSSIELGRRDAGVASANHLIESVARDFDFNLAAPRVRRRSIGRRSAIDLLNHPEFDVKESEKCAKEAEENESREQQGDHITDVNMKTCSPKIPLSIPSTATSETPLSSLSSSTTSSRVSDEEKKEKKNKIRNKENELHLLESKTQKSKTKTVPNSGGLSSIYRSLSLPTSLSLATMKISSNNDRKDHRNTRIEPDFTNEELYVINNHDREWLGNESSYSSIPTVMKNNSFLDMLSSEIQTRYERYREDQKIKETRKLIIEAARKRESLNLRNLVSNNDDYE